MTNDWCTIPEAADYLGVSSDTVRRRITDGSIRAKRLGPRLIRVEVASLSEFGNPLQYVESDH